jgi:hypothetical protein
MARRVYGCQHFGISAIDGDLATARGYRIMNQPQNISQRGKVALFYVLHDNTAKYMKTEKRLNGKKDNEEAIYFFSVEAKKRPVLVLRGPDDGRYHIWMGSTSEKYDWPRYFIKRPDAQPDLILRRHISQIRTLHGCLSQTFCEKIDVTIFDGLLREAQILEFG